MFAVTSVVMRKISPFLLKNLAENFLSFCSVNGVFAVKLTICNSLSLVPFFVAGSCCTVCNQLP